MDVTECEPNQQCAVLLVRRVLCVCKLGGSDTHKRGKRGDTYEGITAQARYSFFTSNVCSRSWIFESRSVGSAGAAWNKVCTCL